MQSSPQTKSPAVMGLSAEAAHPTERSLARFASNEMGPHLKKTVTRHLETCDDCRKIISRHHAIARTFRDWERLAIAQGALEEPR